MKTEFKKNLSIGSYKSGITDYGNWLRIMTIYASRDDGTGNAPGDIDFHFTLLQSENSFEVFEQRCGRSRGSFWTEPERSWFNRYRSFFEAVQAIIKEFGKDRVSRARIGELERW